ncbi:OmpA family protein [Desulfuromonas carbonis]|uniref:OmpA family protein n=1 Tax=Desulfuromonas sp. DDH964 TaxID=1823759 RepID=UPI00078C0D4C|nr:OmpA family protein [Desulfuromonas sp. DDH964]AMV72276.1 peptidoglycan-binding protein, OmpA family [Desulfuromonas sp. DDH964]
MKHGFLACFLGVLLLAFFPVPVDANPTQYGDTGLFSQPTADTLNAGNICIGLWANCSSGPDESSATIAPVAITLGLGSFLEAYGSYPNILFNDEDLASGRGFANLGMKARILGQRSSPFKLSLDGQVRRSISDNKNLDGKTDYLTRAIASFKLERIGLHANFGYQSNQLTYDNYLYGGGLEFFPSSRLRLIAEVESGTERVPGKGGPGEVMAGFQYFFSPHLTVNSGLGFGFADRSPDWRFIFGLSACQGIGTYSRPIPKLVEPEAEVSEPVAEPVKVVKIKTLTPLIPKTVVPVAEPVNKLEVPVEQGKEEIILYPEDSLAFPATALSGAALPISPVGSLPAITTSQTQATVISKPVRTLVYRKFVLPELTFDFNQWVLSAEGEQAVAEIAELLRKDNRWYIIRMDGHTDSIGSYRYNERLSLKRAISYASYMVSHNGVDLTRVFVKGFGESQPIADNATPEGRALNRRVEILVLIPKGGEG